jgi:hypothetical protein
MNAAVQRIHGQFNPGLPFDELRAALAETRCDVIELPRRQPDDWASTPTHDKA